MFQTDLLNHCGSKICAAKVQPCDNFRFVPFVNAFVFGSFDQTIVPLLPALLSRDPLADVACAIHQLDASGFTAGEKIDVALAD